MDSKRAPVVITIAVFVMVATSVALWYFGVIGRMPAAAGGLVLIPFMLLAIRRKKPVAPIPQPVTPIP